MGACAGKEQKESTPQATQEQKPASSSSDNGSNGASATKSAPAATKVSEIKLEENISSGRILGNSNWFYCYGMHLDFFYSKQKILQVETLKMSILWERSSEGNVSTLFYRL